MDKVAACLIVRDGVDVIGAAVTSIRPHVAEVNIYDTGSRDGTLELLDDLARQPGAPIAVERGEWRDDYAWAREQSFAMASPDADWIMWMDDDDVLDASAALSRLGELPDAVSHIIAVRAFDRQKAGPEVRLARPGTAAWRYPIHEQLQPENEERFAFAVPAALHFRHPGQPVGRHAAALTAAEGQPDFPDVYFYLAGCDFARGDMAAGSRRLSHYIADTAGTFGQRRLFVICELARIRGAHGDKRGAAKLLAEAEHEFKEWSRRASAGQLDGLAALGPGWFEQQLQNAAAPAGDRNKPCSCGSGAKTKRCCTSRAFIASPLLPTATSAARVAA